MKRLGGSLMPRCTYLATPLLMLALAAVPRTNSASSETDLEQQFAQTVRPFLVTYCTGCHSGAEPAALLPRSHRGAWRVPAGRWSSGLHRRTLRFR